MNIEQFRKAGYQAIDRICDYHYSLEQLPVVSQVRPGYLKDLIPCIAPEEGEDFQQIADDYQSYIIPGLTHWQHPSFFAYYPTPCTFESILGDLYATSTANPGFNWSCSPACTELEAIVMDWAAKLFGLAEQFLNTSKVGGGVIQTSASDSALVAIVAARSLYTSRHASVKMEDLIIYTTTQTHSLGVKAGLVLGLTSRSLNVTAEDKFALRGETLRRAIEEDKARGKHPFVLVATVGTTSSGAVDRLGEIGEVAKDHPSLWIHVDAAYGGVTLACPEFREIAQLDSINKYADSFCTNFHKWGLVNFDASALWVKDTTHLTNALDVTPEFLRTKEATEGKVTDYRNWHLVLSRRFRSLKIWFVLRSFGAEGFRAQIRKSVKLNDYLVTLLRSSPDFSLVTEPSFALSVFRLTPAWITSAESDETKREAMLNHLNKSFYTRLAARHDIALTQTNLNGKFCIRLVNGAARTKKEHIEHAWYILQEEAKAAMMAWRMLALPNEPRSLELGRL
ncbi:pyridoxal phosphate-dependent transferase [Cytidiella melzeri]|nr:pyridoxal phosphate-dependent transferase [Cytidiella melzeri]